ncbi:MAG: group II intron reverse transcriptase/maturase [Cellulosilyticaceae bacterium]
MKEKHKRKKKQLLRNNEYYDFQQILDELYDKSQRKHSFTNLMNHITCRENILLAYRNIKKNKGSNTKGTDKKTIVDIEKMNDDEIVQLVQSKLKNYMPKSVRRVEIPKPNGTMRPLGIPCIEDRIIQQSIKQILEPICEARFHKHSYGFRPNRSTHHAVARSMRLINLSKLHYVVDIDIKGFFDNVNHAKLIKQLWTLGIRDKELLCVIGKMLKSEIQGVGIPENGVPQGGIISPLLSNVVLNELDWWIGSQWENFKTRKDYSEKYVNIKRTTTLKEMFLVRYADDFKIFCRDYKTAQKVFIATKQWLKDRLELEVNIEKSRVTNLRKNHTDFLGFKLKAKKKGKDDKYVCKSNISDKAKKMLKDKLKKQVLVLQKSPTIKEASKLNAMILGMHQYYKIATHVSLDFRNISYRITRNIDIRLRRNLSSQDKRNTTYRRIYKGYEGKCRTICDITIYPIYGCKTCHPMNFSQQICNYTEQGRSVIHEKLNGITHLIKYILRAYSRENVEMFDNSISLIVAQRGKCAITGRQLIPQNMEIHHKVMKSQAGTDKYENLLWLSHEGHKLVHAVETTIINKYLEKLRLDNKQVKKLNKLRCLVGNSDIILDI